MRGTAGYPLIDAEEVRIVTADGSRGAAVPATRPARLPAERAVEQPAASHPEPASGSPTAQAQRRAGDGVLRVPDPQRVRAAAEAAAAALEEETEPVEFEPAAEERSSEADRHRLRARVVLRR
jgi:hypothetical protein